MLCLQIPLLLQNANDADFKLMVIKYANKTNNFMASRKYNILGKIQIDAGTTRTKVIKKI
jgi:hypothetical protein